MLHDLRHVSKEIQNITALNLAIVPGRQYDPNQVAKIFTAMVKIKEFNRDVDSFDDLFEQAERFSQVLHLASLKLDPEDLREFHIYRNKRLEQVPLDLLQIEEVSEPTPSVCLEESSKHNSNEESQEKSAQGSEDSEHESGNKEGSPEANPEQDTEENREETIEKVSTKQDMETSPP